MRLPAVAVIAGDRSHAVPVSPVKREASPVVPPPAAKPKASGKSRRSTASAAAESLAAAPKLKSRVAPTGRIQTRQGVLIDHLHVGNLCRRFHIQLLAVIHEVKPLGAGANDWDMLVEFTDGEAPPSKFETVALEIELERMAERRIDLRTREQLRLTTSRELLDAATPVFVS